MRAPMERVLIAAAVGAAALFPSAALFAVPRVPLEQPSFSRAQGGSPPLSVALGSVSLSLAVAFAAVRPLSRRMAGSTLAATKLRSRATRVACRAMFERFSPGSMKAVMLAQGESRNLGHDYVGAEMLVVGILAEGNERGSRALEAAGIKLQEAKAKLREMVGTGGGGKENAEIPLTQEAMKVLEEAGDMSKREDCAMVGSEHILRAIMSQDESLGTKLIGHMLGCRSPEETREKVLPKINEASNDVSGTVSVTAAGEASGEMKLTETMKYAEDLTSAAEEGSLDPLVGRDVQLERTIRILGRRSKNNPVYVGEAGVGKTSIACGLAQRIVQGRVPPTLRDKRVLSLDLALLLAGTRYRGDFEERLRAVVKEVSESNRRVILVIDEVHTLVGAGSSGGEGGGMDAANLLKPALARGLLQCIGATTLDEYRQYIEKDPALERRFQPIMVPEPTEEESEQILQGLAPRYERHHQLRYEPEAIRASVRLASQYINDRFLPDKAIDVMDEAGAKVRQQLFQEEEMAEDMAERRKLERELQSLKEKKSLAVANEEFTEAQALKLRQEELNTRLSSLVGKMEKNSPAGTGDQQEKLRLLRARVEEAVAAERFDEASELKAKEREVLGAKAEEVWVTEADVAQVVSGWTGIAVEQVSATESARLLQLESKLGQSVIGQQDAVSSVSRALRRARAGLRNPGRPIAAFMFCGPTGVGKTELCKKLSSSFFGSAEAMIRLDMSEFMEKHTVSKLLGAPPGYVGYGEGGTLTEAVRRRPYSLVLFDEVEKAHPDVFNTLLQLLDDGRLTDSKGRVVSFSNTLVVMTSNLGSRSVQKGAGGGLGLGFGTEEDSSERSYNAIREAVHEEMKSFFRPEFLNRLDEICVFRPLTKENIRAIAEVEFNKVAARLLEAGMHVSLTARFKERVVQEGFDPAYGARPLRRAITRWLEDSLAEHLLDSTAHPEENDLEQRALVDLREDGSVQVHRLPNVKKEEKELTEA
mmetsp:Transcript_88979/g.212394  ORF Transcript_88979/g.212394 Transcript_88979/m.212394 type:complete len:989 (+) Transcript_88979:109-3075(+)